MNTYKVKLFHPFVAPEAASLVAEVLQSGYLAEGARVKEFERLLEEYTGKQNIVSLNSGTSALELCYEFAGIKEGDEVITPVLTCTATNIPLVRRKANIVFADINDGLNISVKDVARKIHDGTKAVVFVHFGGNNRGLEEIRGLCLKHGVILIEDAAQAIGSDTWGLGDHVAVSFQAIKTLTTGDGGAYLGVDHERARLLRWFGYDRDKKHAQGDIDLTEAGYKYHMNDIAATIGIANLRRLHEYIAHKEKIASIYLKVGLFTYTWLAGGFTETYDELIAEAAKRGFEFGQHHYRNDKYTLFGGRKSLPKMDALERKYFFVPFHSNVSEQDANEIAELCLPYLIP